MRGAGKGSQSWTSSGRLNAIRDAQSRKQAKARALVERIEPRATFQMQALEDVALASPLVYRRKANQDVELTAAPVKPVLDAIGRSCGDRRDRVVLCWPVTPDNGFVAIALHLLEGRVSRRHVHGAVGFWPWRSGATWSSRSILVGPDALVRHGREAAQERREGNAWTKEFGGDDAIEMAFMRLHDLRASASATREGVTVRQPTLFELTAFFRPQEAGGSPYVAHPYHFLHRIRQYTEMGDRGGSTKRFLDVLGDPKLTPLPVFGLPANDRKLLRRCLGYERFREHPLDVVVADLTHTSIAEMGPSWPSKFQTLLEVLAGDSRSRPGVVVVTDDAFAFRKAEVVMKEVGHSQKPRTPFPSVEGALFPVPGFLGRATAPMSFAPFEARADLKDGRLLQLRDDVLAAARELERAEDVEAASALRAGFAHVRAAATFPVGLREAREIVEVMFAGDDPHDVAMRQRFYFEDACRALTEQISLSPYSVRLSDFKAKYRTMVEAWDAATPVSLKLSEMARSDRSGKNETLLVLPDRHVADIYRLSDGVVSTNWQIADAKSLAEHAGFLSCRRWVLVRPSNAVLRTVLMASPGPDRVDLVGDAAGSGLLLTELKPLASLPAFAPIKERANALLTAIGRSMASLASDHEEATLRGASRIGRIDFTRGDGEYTGPVIRIETERGYELLYRPGSEVLRHTPDDLRDFERIEAKDIEPADTILVLSQRLMESLRRELARAPKTVEALRAYHTAVAVKREQITGAKLRDKARRLTALIKELHPTFDDDEFRNVERWLAVDKDTTSIPDAQPQAPSTRERFGWFVEALGYPNQLADAWWVEGIRKTRSYSISEGLLFNQRAVAFVVDPESMKARNGTLNVGALQAAIIDNVDAVKKIEEIKGVRRA
jgi:hypothetical protein